MIPGLKIIDDILKGLPENARLRSQIEELRPQIERLESELKDAHSEIQRLRQKYESDDSLDEPVAQILVAIANEPDGLTQLEFHYGFGLLPGRADKIRDILIERKFIQQIGTNVMTGPRYGATPKGRDYLDQKGLLGWM